MQHFQTNHNNQLCNGQFMPMTRIEQAMWNNPYLELTCSTCGNSENQPKNQNPDKLKLFVWMNEYRFCCGLCHSNKVDVGFFNNAAII